MVWTSTIGFGPDDIEPWTSVLVPVTIGVVAILTYLSARRTLFQPLRTEVFKLQLQHALDILKQFARRSDLDLRRDLGITDLVELNAALTLVHHFNLQQYRAPEDVVERLESAIHGGAFPLDQQWIRSDASSEFRRSDDTSNYVTTVQQFKYPADGVALTEPYFELRARLDAIRLDPLTPEAALPGIEQLTSALSDTVKAIGQTSETLLESLTSDQLPHNTDESTFRAAFVNEFNDRAPSLETATKPLVTTLRGLFGLGMHGELERRSRFLRRRS